MGAFQKADAGQEKSRFRSAQQECIFCYACEGKFCPVDAIHIGAGPPGRVRPAEDLLPSRRAFLGTLAAGAVLGPAFILDQRTRTKAETALQLRPPGALVPDSEFISACIRCGECIRVCPKNALQMSGTRNGIAGLWTPHFEFNVGPCDYWCGVSFEEAQANPGKTANLCALVCPTGAIQKLSQTEKSAWKIGTAFIDRSRCIPWNEGEQCRVCEEKCPVHAISRDGIRPYVNQSRCIGCGMCENVCPIDGPSAVQVFPYQTEAAYGSDRGEGPSGPGRRGRSRLS